MFRVLAVVAWLAAPAHADEPCELPCHVAKVRELLASGEAIAARDELVRLHAQYAQAELLFALGQVELQLENYEAAITYYERFIATNPGEDQVSLAQQAIGAARMAIARPKTDPRPIVVAPPPKFERRWNGFGTLLVVTGAASLVTGGALLYNAHQLGNDTSGTIGEYDDRLEHAEARRVTGYAFGAAGVLAVAVALVRWRFDLTPSAGSIAGRRRAHGSWRTLVVEQTKTGITVGMRGSW